MFAGIHKKLLVMTSRTLRRRLHHGDVDGKRKEHLDTSDFGGLDEPLLGNHNHDDLHSEVSLYNPYSGFL